MRHTDDHIKKIADLKKAMLKKIPDLIQIIQDSLSHSSARHLACQSYHGKCREVLPKLEHLKKDLLALNPENKSDVQKIIQTALLLINDASINLIFPDNKPRLSILDPHWTLSGFGQFSAKLGMTSKNKKSGTHQLNNGIK